MCALRSPTRPTVTQCHREPGGRVGPGRCPAGVPGPVPAARTGQTPPQGTAVAFRGRYLGVRTRLGPGYAERVTYRNIHPRQFRAVRQFVQPHNKSDRPRNCPLWMSGGDLGYRSGRDRGPDGRHRYAPAHPDAAAPGENRVATPERAFLSVDAAAVARRAVRSRGAHRHARGACTCKRPFGRESRYRSRTSGMNRYLGAFHNMRSGRNLISSNTFDTPHRSRTHLFSCCFADRTRPEKLPVPLLAESRRPPATSPASPPAPRIRSSSLARRIGTRPCADQRGFFD